MGMRRRGHDGKKSFRWLWLAYMYALYIRLTREPKLGEGKWPEPYGCRFTDTPRVMGRLHYHVGRKGKIHHDIKGAVREGL